MAQAQTTVSVSATAFAALEGAIGSAVVFPLPGESRAGTPFKDGLFRAYRPGHRGRGCGRGHCGVDLSAPDGTPVLAAKAGTIFQIKRSNRGGLWIELTHEDGRQTWYMHLATIRDDLQPGMHVGAGDVLGTLGRTGVSTSPTHLHFAVSTGKPGRELHVNPNPLLEAGELLPEAP
jgi:murein DD-endopeptidase MepM/ murein hydrolase activator NlpD